MENKETVLEGINEFTKVVITTINLITKSNFKGNESTKKMFKSTLNYLEDCLKINDSNKSCIEEAIEFNLFQSEFIENQDEKFTFREKTNLVFKSLNMMDSSIYNIIVECINSIEADISVRNKVFN